jgi:hypothetical protein
LLTLSNNPFGELYSKAFFNQTMKIAEENDRFRSQVYTPFVHARMALATQWSKGILLHLDGDRPLKECKQGRRKIFSQDIKNKGAPETNQDKGFST